MIAEFLAQEAEEAHGHLRQAFARAARHALLWPVEAHELWASKSPLTSLDGIGPFLAHRLEEWFTKPRPRLTPPAIRTEFLTLTQARRILDRHLASLPSLQGDLHAHTQWSDGSATLEDLAQSAKDRGYAFIAITDHTKGLKIAGGLDETKLAEQGKEIDRLNLVFSKRSEDFTILKSAEVNLSPSGAIDIRSEAMRQLDLVIGSFHSAIRRVEDQTGRYIAALRNRHLHILGHPQGRIFNHRAGLNADWGKVFAEAARLDKAVEVDGYPDRQDLRISLLRLARTEGCRISLGTDAHHSWQLAFMAFALAGALLAGFEQDRIVNFMSVRELKQWSSRISASG